MVRKDRFASYLPLYEPNRPNHIDTIVYNYGSSNSHWHRIPLHLISLKAFISNQNNDRPPFVRQRSGAKISLAGLKSRTVQTLASPY